MIEVFGFPLGSPFAAGTLATVLFACLVWWIRGMPDRHRVRNEEQVISDADDAQKRKEYRQEIHAIKNELAKAVVELARCNKVASDAAALNEQMMFLFELMLSEMEHTHADSKIVQRARIMFDRLKPEVKDPSKSDALHTAETAVADAKQTLESTKDTCEEVKRSEDS